MALVVSTFNWQKKDHCFGIENEVLGYTNLRMQTLKPRWKHVRLVIPDVARYLMVGRRVTLFSITISRHQFCRTCTMLMAKSWTKSMSMGPSCKARCIKREFAVPIATIPTRPGSSTRTIDFVLRAISILRANMTARHIITINRDRPEVNAWPVTCQCELIWPWMIGETTVCACHAPICQYA